MNESTARAERFDAQTASSPLYLWEVPQKPVSVRIPFSLIDRLEKEAVESFRSLTSSGSEIGGLLVGDVAPGSPLVVTIADYDLIACDYSRGPLYRLSDADMGRFEHAIQKRLAAGRGVAGYFRSHTRKGISLDADDLTFFQARFREPHQIALLVRPFATKASTAGIFIWENGQVNADASYLEFPFRSSELGPGQPPQAPEPKAAAPAAPPPPAPKSAARAQIVPIASRREISIPAEPAPPAPAAMAAPPAPVVEQRVEPRVEQRTEQRTEQRAAPLQDRQSKIEKPDKYDKPDRYSKPEKFEKTDKFEKYDRTAKTDKTAKSEPPAAKTATSSRTESKADTRTEKAVAAASVVAAPEFIAPEAKGGKGVKLLLAAAAMVAAFVGLFVYPGVLRTNSKPPAVATVKDSSQLQLRVERAAGELMLTWNPDAEVIKNASKGVLTITDGEQKQNVDMDLASLAAGKIMYSPAGREIHFEMKVTDKAGKSTSTDSIPILLPPSPLQDQAAVSAKNAAPAVTSKPTPGAVPPPPGVTATEPAADQPAATKPSAPLKQFQASSLPLAQRLRPVAPNDMPDAPTAASTGGANPLAIPGIGNPAAAPLAPAPAAPSAAAPNDSKPKAGGNLQPAVLVYRKAAEYPRIAKQTGAKGAVVLTATIGTDGTIKKVKVVSGHPMLTQAAKDAVMQWRYTPTLLNGQAVEAETQVMVNFVPDQR